MAKLSNVALNKKATQSSLSKYSHGMTIEEDASFAISDDLDSDLVFHTDREEGPWWQVDLQEEFIVENIVIYNRRIEQRRFVNFTVLYSLDHVTWSALFRKCDPRTFEVLEIPVRKATIARFIRIRLDARDFLHLRQVQVFGRKPSACLPQPPMVEKVVFSVLYNDQPGYLRPMIDNFLKYTDENVAFVVNLSKASSIDLTDFDSIPRVLFIRGNFDRFANGHTLLAGHLESFHAAKTALSKFDYFSPLASNCLFVRPFSMEGALALLKSGSPVEWHVPSSAIVEMSDGLTVQSAEWNYPSIALQPSFLELVYNDMGVSTIIPMQIEGLIASYSHWSALAGFLEKITACGRALNVDHLFPMEETLPASFFNRFFGGGYALICQVLWHPFRSCVRLEEIIQPAWYFPDEISIAKWFERDVRVPETASLTTGRGRVLLDIISSQMNLGDMDDLLSYSQMLHGFARAIDHLIASSETYWIRQ